VPHEVGDAHPHGGTDQSAHTVLSFLPLGVGKRLAVCAVSFVSARSAALLPPHSAKTSNHTERFITRGRTHVGSNTNGQNM